MEAFSLLKYWRGGGGGVGVGIGASSNTTTSPAPNAATILAAVAQNENATESDDDGDGDDDGPFFDLEFTVPDEVEVDDSEEDHENANDNHNSHEEEEDEEESDDEREFKIALSPSSNDRSPSEDLLFKGKVVQVEPSSFVVNPSEPNSKPQFTASLLKSATKFRVFMLGLKKPNKSDSAAPNPHQPEHRHNKQQQEAETETETETERIKFKVEEVPIISLFTRGNKSQSLPQNHRKHNAEESQLQSQSPSCSEEKRFSKEVVMHKYLKMVKPFYIRVSRRYGDKLGQLSLRSAGGGKAPPPPAVTEGGGGAAVAETTGSNVKSQKQGNLPLPAGLRVVYKHLGKSRSASSAVAASPPAPPFVSSKRRDDSLLQQQDGIQGAILHCKRSFNASRECESSQLPRSVSDPLREISPELSTNSNHDN